MNNDITLDGIQVRDNLISLYFVAYFFDAARVIYYVSFLLILQINFCNGM